ncbi:hypothetical protein GCM10027032_19130 [Simplicispira piscis]
MLSGGSLSRTFSPAHWFIILLMITPLMALLKRYAAKFRELGVLRFQIEEVAATGRPEKFALLIVSTWRIL